MMFSREKTQHHFPAFGAFRRDGRSWLEAV